MPSISRSALRPLSLTVARRGSRLASANRAFLQAAVIAVIAAIGVLTTLGAAPAAAAIPAGSHAFASLGDAKGLGDINGDGFDDIGDATGRVAFGAADLATSRITTFSVPPANQRRVAKLGDIDGDGYDDFSVGELANSNSASGAYVIYGAPGTTGIPVTQGARVGLVRAGAAVNGPQIRGVGDFSGDGIDDIAVFRVTGSSVSSALRGGWTIVLGGTRFASLDATVSSPRTLMLDGNTSCRTTYYWGFPVGYTCEENSGDLVPAGDVNGDGKDDVVFSTVFGPSLRGILFGRATGFGTSMKLTQTTAPSALFDGNPQEALPIAAGDVDADGKDDLLLRCAGLSGNVTIHRGRTVAASSQFSLASPAWTFTGNSSCPRPVPVGDIDGDGGADLIAQQMNRTVVAQGIGTMETGAITGLRSKPQGTSTPMATLPPVTGVAQVWAHEPYGFGGSIRHAAGDLDGDGLSDLLFDDEQGRAVVATFGPDRLAPEVAFRYAGIESSERIYAAAVSPSGFTPGAGAATISLVLDGPATVRFTVKRAGATVGSFERALPALKSETPWDGRVNGTPLPDGDYAMDVTPRDAAGNTGATRTMPFKVGGGATGPASATVSLRVDLLGPDGQPIAGTVDWSAICPDGSSPLQAGNTTMSLTPYERFAGDRCQLHILRTLDVTSVEGCTWKKTYTANGVPTTPVITSDVDFTLKGGVNTVAATVQCVGGTAVSASRPGRFDSPRWLKYGSASIQSSTSALLTPASANQAGAVVWPDAFDPANTSFTFNVTMSGGNNTAEGIAMAFIPATSSLPPTTGPLGAGGGALGLGGLPFTAVALDSFKQPSDPANAFLGIATGSNGNSLTYAQTADPGIRLRTANILVSVTYKNGELSIATQGKVRLRRAVTLPSRVYLALSAATNPTAWQQHVVNNFSTAGA